MGADMCLAVMCFKGTGVQFEREWNNVSLKLRLLKAVEKAKMTEFGEFIEHTGMEVDEEDYSQANDEFEERVRNKAQYAVEEAFKWIGGRQTTWIGHKNVTFVCSGGLSWGDAPSEAYDAILRFVSLPKSVLDVAKVSGSW